MSKTHGLRIAVIAGSARPGNFTSKAAALVATALAEHDHVGVDIFHGVDLDLRLPGRGDPTPSALAMKTAVEGAAGVVLCTPEYHGCFSAQTKLAIENLGFPSVLAGKPIALVGVAAGRIGAIKSLESLAGVCLHVGAIVLPGPMSIAGVRKVFDEEGRCLDPTVEERLRALATSLVEYIGRAVCPAASLEAAARS